MGIGNPIKWGLPGKVECPSTSCIPGKPGGLVDHARLVDQVCPRAGLAQFIIDYNQRKSSLIKMKIQNSFNFHLLKTS